MIKLTIAGISYNEIQTGAYSVVLTPEDDRSKRVAIIIGTPEAQSIATVLEELDPPRPLTHDVFNTFITGAGARLKQVEIHHYKDGVFYSDLIFERSGKPLLRLDARPSDALALAIRANASVFMADDIFKALSTQPITQDTVSQHIVKEPRSLKAEYKQLHETDSLKQMSKEQLHEEMQKAITGEDYERAARISELIREKNQDSPLRV
ncbi:hypothetical protein SAMD00024442_16_62 [Candidatus Symbiothrix dinenymphae]|nr:hypothetical protein SAMD00024442_16_62 [Candidatus Symbiothrix dinenymphae]